MNFPRILMPPTRDARGNAWRVGLTVVGLLLAALAVAALLSGCGGGGGGGGSTTSTPAGTVTPSMVTVKGAIPATTGVPSVKVNGVAATITGGTAWSSDVPMATALAGPVTVEFYSDGALIATKEVKVTIH